MVVMPQLHTANINFWNRGSTKKCVMQVRRRACLGVREWGGRCAMCVCECVRAGE